MITRSFSASAFRQAFPAILQPSVYLDSAATALKPVVMIDATSQYYAQNSSTAYRSHHTAAADTTRKLNDARHATATLINAKAPENIIWTSGATGAINLVAQSLSDFFLQAGDEILVSELEHHSNLVPWLMAAKRSDARVVKLPLDAQGLPSPDLLRQHLTPRTKLLAITQMSNVTGAVPDLPALIALAHKNGTYVLIDGAQGIVHGETDVQALDADFYCFSAHKLYGPTGVGVLYGKTELLDLLPPAYGGGKMLTTVDFEGFESDVAPARFEAGTPNIAGILGFGATLTWLAQIDRVAADVYSAELAHYAEEKFRRLAGFISYRAPTSPILAFNFNNIHHSDIATLLAEQHIAIRSGQHCAQPFMNALGISGCVRASFAPYNTAEDVDKLVSAVFRALDLLR